MKKFIFSVIVCFIVFGVAVTGFNSYVAEKKIDTYELSIVTEKEVSKLQYEKITTLENNAEFPYDDYLKEYFTLDRLVTITGEASGYHKGVSIPPYLVGTGTEYTYSNSLTIIKHLNSADFSEIVNYEIDTFKQLCDTTRSLYNLNRDKSTISFNNNVVTFLSYKGLPTILSTRIMDYLTYEKTFKIDLSQFDKSMYPSGLQLFQTEKYKTLNRVEKELIGASLYKPFYRVESRSDTYYVIDTATSALITQGAECLAQHIFNLFSDISVTIKDLKCQDNKTLVYDTFGTGVLLKNNIRTMLNSSLTTGEVIKLIDGSTSRAINFTGNRLNVNEEFAGVFKNTEGETSRPKYIQRSEKEYIRVEYPFKQVSGSIKNSEGYYPISYEDVGLINLFTEEIHVTDSGDTKSFNSQHYGNYKTFKLVGNTQPEIISSTLMECITYNDELYHTGRLINLGDINLTDNSLIKYDNAELADIDSTKLGYYTSTDPDGNSIINIKNKMGVGNCIVLNKDCYGESGLREYLNSSISAEISEKYKVDVVSIGKILSGEYTVNTFELTDGQLAKIEGIRSELERININNKLKGLRVSLIVLGAFIFLYISILFIAYTFDRSGGIIGVELLPIISFKNIKMDYNSIGDITGNKKQNKTGKKVLTIIILGSIIGMLCVTGGLYKLVVENLITLYFNIVGG